MTELERKELEEAKTARAYYRYLAERYEGQYTAWKTVALIAIWFLSFVSVLVITFLLLSART